MLKNSLNLKKVINNFIRDPYVFTIMNMYFLLHLKKLNLHYFGDLKDDYKE